MKPAASPSVTDDRHQFGASQSSTQLTRQPHGVDQNHQDQKPEAQEQFGSTK